jgi:hypothetical protein
MSEITVVEMLLTLNTAGWGLAIWLGKRQLLGLSNKVDVLTEKVATMIARDECDDNRTRIWSKYDKLSDRQKESSERLARLEGPK